MPSPALPNEEEAARGLVTSALTSLPEPARVVIAAAAEAVVEIDWASACSLWLWLEEGVEKGLPAAILTLLRPPLPAVAYSDGMLGVASESTVHARLAFPFPLAWPPGALMVCSSSSWDRLSRLWRGCC